MVLDGTSRERLAATIAQILFSLVAIIQLAIAVGIAPITIVWGGHQTVLTPFLRMASLFAIVVLLGFAWILQQRVDHPESRCFQMCSWIIAGYMALNTLGNFTSPSWFERYVFGVITMALSICSAVVASTPARQRSGYESFPEEDAAVTRGNVSS